MRSCFIIKKNIQFKLVSTCTVYTEQNEDQNASQPDTEKNNGEFEICSCVIMNNNAKLISISLCHSNDMF